MSIERGAFSAIEPPEQLSGLFLERSFRMVTQAQSIIDAIKNLTETSATIKNYAMNDGLYTPFFKKSKRALYAGVEQVQNDNIEINPDSGEEVVVEGDQIVALLEQRRSGYTRITVTTEMSDTSGVSYKGASTYEFSPYRPYIKHEGEGFAYHHIDRKPYPNIKTTNQDLLFADAEELLNSMEDTVREFLDESIQLALSGMDLLSGSCRIHQTRL